MIAALTGGAFALPAREPEVSEYQVKAAFLLNFARFVEWPAEKFSSGEAPIQICVVGDDPFEGSLERVVADRRANGRALEVRRPASDEDAESCHVLFTARGSPGPEPSSLARWTSAHVLSVGENERFLEAGGVISFYLEDRSVRFEISRGNAARSGLVISSQLLNLARRN